ncbi:MAG: hypothetical protein QOI53_10 [Verrucomicrobiota bacterium]|jgi:hypothetical protein|nr:hypothetical protein [Verrucomicrobiota bacterium]
MSGEADTEGARCGRRLVNFIDGSTFEEAAGRIAYFNRPKRREPFRTPGRSVV